MFVIKGVFVLVLRFSPVVVFVAGGQQLDACPCIHYRQLRELGHNLIQKGFRPRPVDEQQIRPGQGDHIFRGELKVMKAAGLRLSQAFYRDALHPVGQVQRRHIYRIKGGHNPQIRLFFVGYPGEQGDNR